ncbi:hypothetical protein BaRGS_00003264 [Batillaria attramentaria]|uniref:Secreted protein n=1 Tax=Batillaria attramentaria TaxID=370345 RepID=A0ABD0M0S4_9CAEN
MLVAFVSIRAALTATRRHTFHRLYSRGGVVEAFPVNHCVQCNTTGGQTFLSHFLHYPGNCVQCRANKNEAERPEAENRCRVLLSLFNRVEMENKLGRLFACGLLSFTV